MQPPDYDQHEIQYRFLRDNGFDGWGGENLRRRMMGWQETVEKLAASSQFPEPGSSILEIGCGAGDSLLPFAELRYQVSGIDVSPTAIHWAREKFNSRRFQSHFEVANLAMSLPFSDGVFDAVIDAACLHCLIACDRAVALSAIQRVLKSGGFFLVSHMVNDPRELPDGVSFDLPDRLQIKNGAPYRSMPKLETLSNELMDRGFQIVQQNIRQNRWWDHAEFWCRKSF